MAVIRGQLIFAVDLRLTTILRGTSRPNLDTPALVKVEQMIRRMAPMSC